MSEFFTENIQKDFPMERHQCEGIPMDTEIYKEDDGWFLHEIPGVFNEDEFGWGCIIKFCPFCGEGLK